MSYREQAEAAAKSGRSQNVVADIVTWDTEGQEVIGKVTGIEAFTEGGFDAECNKYTLDTDTGPVSLVMGTATDKALSKYDLRGLLLRIVYQGKKALADGRRVNRFQVYVGPPEGKGK